MKPWLLNELPEGYREVELPSLSARKGSERLGALEALLGEEAGPAALEAGPYLLDDALVRNLRMEGLSLPDSGELPALSPSRWKKVSLPSWGEIGGLILSSRQEEALSSFLQGRWPESAEALLEIAAHFFYEHNLKVAVRYTGPRFHRP